VGSVSKDKTRSAKAPANTIRSILQPPRLWRFPSKRFSSKRYDFTTLVLSGAEQSCHRLKDGERLLHFYPNDSEKSRHSIKYSVLSGARLEWRTRRFLPGLASYLRRGYKGREQQWWQLWEGRLDWIRRIDEEGATKRDTIGGNRVPAKGGSTMAYI